MLQYLLKYDDSRPKRLKDALRDEKLYGPSTSRDPEKRSANFHVFKNTYFLIEEYSGQYKPIMVKDFDESATHPSIQWENSKGRCAFIAENKTHEESDEEEPESEQDKEVIEEYRARLKSLEKDTLVQMPVFSGDDVFDLDNLPSQDLDHFKKYAKEKLELYEKIKSSGMPNSTASGLVSGSVAATVPRRDMNKDPRLAYIGQRVLSLTDKGKSTEKSKKQQRSVRLVPGKSFYHRPGYCENCNVKYDRFVEVCFVANLHE